MKVFVSHKQEDSQLAGAVAQRLAQNNVEYYLDVMDPDVISTADDLADHIRVNLSKCTDLMAVVSERTKMSWWVPWEIGVATEKEYPLSTFAGDRCELPLYLKKWPYLRTLTDIDAYVRVAKQVRQVIVERHGKTAAAGGAIYTRQFHASLRQTLGQM